MEVSFGRINYYCVIFGEVVNVFVFINVEFCINFVNLGVFFCYFNCEWVYFDVFNFEIFFCKIDFECFNVGVEVENFFIFY